MSGPQSQIMETELPISIEDWHVYAIDWSPDGVRFLLAGELIGSTGQSPDHAMHAHLL